MPRPKSKRVAATDVVYVPPLGYSVRIPRDETHKEYERLQKVAYANDAKGVPGALSTLPYHPDVALTLEDMMSFDRVKWVIDYSEDGNGHFELDDRPAAEIPQEKVEIKNLEEMMSQGSGQF